MSLGRAIQSAREAASLSRADLAEKCGVNVRTIESIEQGRTPRPAWDTVATLARSLGTTVEQLAGDTTPTTKPGRGRPRKVVPNE